MFFPGTAPDGAPALGWVFLVLGIGFAFACFYVAWRLERRD